MPSKRPSFPKVSDEMKRFAALLEAELARWPDVHFKRMFGMVSVRRNETIFALLPATRSLRSANSIMLKFERPAERESEKWEPVELTSEADLPRVLRRLDEAYRKAVVVREVDTGNESAATSRRAEPFNRRSRKGTSEGESQV